MLSFGSVNWTEQYAIDTKEGSLRESIETLLFEYEGSRLVKYITPEDIDPSANPECYAVISNINSTDKRESCRKCEELTQTLADERSIKKLEQETFFTYIQMMNRKIENQDAHFNEKILELQKSYEHTKKDDNYVAHIVSIKQELMRTKSTILELQATIDKHSEDIKINNDEIGILLDTSESYLLDAAAEILRRFLGITSPVLLLINFNQQKSIESLLEKYHNFCTVDKFMEFAVDIMQSRQQSTQKVNAQFQAKVTKALKVYQRYYTRKGLVPSELVSFAMSVIEMSDEFIGGIQNS